jgi:Secretion system C-terminal sorting domain
MKRNKTLLALLFGSMQFAAFAQNNYLYGLISTPPTIPTNTSTATTRLGRMDLTTGELVALSPNSLSSISSATGAALDPNTQTYYYETQTEMISVDLNTGLTTAQAVVSNPIQPSYFDNYRYNTSDSTIYGLGRISTSTGIGQANGELYLSSINPATGVITQISPQSVGEMYTVQGNAIDPHEMVYYYSFSGHIIGLDIYTGLVYSDQEITYPEGGMFFDNYTYNCADTTIYGIIRANTTAPNEFYLGKIDPNTGVATRISQQPIPYHTYSLNGSSTIDPNNGVYYFAAKSTAVIPAINVVVGVSLATGTVVFEQVMTLPGTAVNSRYFNLLRYPTDCAEAFPTRVNPNSGSAGLAAANKSTLKVAPNPFEQQFTVTSAELIEAITLRDAQGKVVLQQAASSNTLEVETCSLQSGVYFLEVQTARGLQVSKLLK